MSRICLSLVKLLYASVLIITQFFFADIAWIRLNRKPVNSLNTDMLMELNLAIENVENNESYRGAILTSVSYIEYNSGFVILNG